MGPLTPSIGGGWFDDEGNLIGDAPPMLAPPEYDWRSGQDRTAWMRDTVGGAADYFLGPTGINDRVDLLAQFLNPITGMHDAQQQGRRVAQGDTSAIIPMLTEIVGAVAPAAGYRLAGGNLDDISEPVLEMLQGWSLAPASEVGRFIQSEEGAINIPGPWKDQNTNIAEELEPMWSGHNGFADLIDHLEKETGMKFNKEMGKLVDETGDFFGEPAAVDWSAAIEMVYGPEVWQKLQDARYMKGTLDDNPPAALTPYQKANLGLPPDPPKELPSNGISVTHEGSDEVTMLPPPPLADDDDMLALFREHWNNNKLDKFEFFEQLQDSTGLKKLPLNQMADPTGDILGKPGKVSPSFAVDMLFGDGAWKKVHHQAFSGDNPYKYNSQLNTPIEPLTDDDLTILGMKPAGDGDDLIDISEIKFDEDQVEALAGPAKAAQAQHELETQINEAFAEADADTLKQQDAAFQFKEKIFSDKLGKPNVVFLSDMTKIGEKPGGSAQGAMYETSKGTKYMVKSYGPGTEANVYNEIAASDLLTEMDVNTPAMSFGPTDGKYAGDTIVASKWIDDLEPFDVDNPAHVKAAQQDFGAHALIANWDAIGLSFDNTMMGPGNTPVMVDPGGALAFRAQGSPKGDKFTDSIWTDVDGMRDPSINPSAAKVYGSMTDAEIEDSISRAVNKLGQWDEDEGVWRLSAGGMSALTTSNPMENMQRRMLRAKLEARLNSAMPNGPDGGVSRAAPKRSRYVQQAQEILGLLQTGDADRITNQMFENLGPGGRSAEGYTYLRDNYDLPTDAESIAARRDLQTGGKTVWHDMGGGPARYAEPGDEPYTQPRFSGAYPYHLSTSPGPQPEFARDKWGQPGRVTELADYSTREFDTMKPSTILDAATALGLPKPIAEDVHQFAIDAQTAKIMNRSMDNVHARTDELKAKVTQAQDFGLIDDEQRMALNSLISAIRDNGELDSSNWTAMENHNLLKLLGQKGFDSFGMREAGMPTRGILSTRNLRFMDALHDPRLRHINDLRAGIAGAAAGAGGLSLLPSVEEQEGM